MPNDMYGDKCAPVEKFDNDDKCRENVNLSANLWSNENFKKLPNNKTEKDLHDVDFSDDIILKKKLLAEKEDNFDSDVILKKKLGSAKELDEKAAGGEFSKKVVADEKGSDKEDEAVILKKKLAAEDDAVVLKKKLAAEDDCSTGDNTAVLKKKLAADKFEKSDGVKKFDKLEKFDKFDKFDKFTKCDKTDADAYLDKLDKLTAQKSLPEFDKDFQEKKYFDKKLPEKQPIEVKNEIGDRLLADLHRGSFGDRDERALLEGQISSQAKLAGRQGEQQVLDKLNNALSNDGSPYRLRFGQNHIKTPGGRRLEIVDARGQVTDQLDFIVPTKV